MVSKQRKSLLYITSTLATPGVFFL